MRPTYLSCTPKRYPSFRRCLIVTCLLVLTLNFVGCALYSNGTFEAFSGPSEFVGHGGTKRTIDGIDVWDFGLPPRRCRLLGFIYQRTVADASVLSFVANMDTLHEIIKQAKQVGGDAIVIGPSADKVVGYNGQVDQYGNFSANSTTVSNGQIAVLKYSK